MIRRLFFSGTCGLVLLLSSVTTPAHAQEWAQEFQIVTPIESGSPLQLFLDSLTTALDRSPDVMVRRSPQDGGAMSYVNLREQLYDDGVDLTSASHVYVRYRLDSQREGSIVERVEDLYFILRLDEYREDLPILYVTSRTPFVGQVLTGSGFPSLVNIKSITFFREIISFPYLNKHPETTLVEIGRRTLRGDFSREQIILRNLLSERVNRGSGYILDTAKSSPIASGGTPETRP